MSEVIKFTGITYHDLPVDQVIENANNAELSGCLVIGWDKSDELYFAGSVADAERIIWLLECAKKRIMDHVK